MPPFVGVSMVFETNQTRKNLQKDFTEDFY